MQKKSAYVLLAVTMLPISLLYTNCGSGFGASAVNLSQSSVGTGSSGDSTSGSSGGSSGGSVSGGSGAGSASTVTTSTANFVAPFTPAKTVTVCASGCDYTLPSQAFAAAQDMELIKVSVGNYQDCGTITAPNVWVKGVGGMAHMDLPPGTVACGKKGIIVADGANLTVDNLEFSGAAIAAGDGNNGAGIRFEGTNLTVRNSDFHDNQNGILTNSTVTGNIHIQNSHFARNGADGYEHDMYIGHVASFLIENSVVEQANQGHPVKTRASKSTIQCNQIMNGYDSAYAKNGYLIDMPNGGEERILNNTIAQGTFNGGQHTLIAFAAEGGSNPTQTLELNGNILLNDLGAGTFVNLFNPTSTPATFMSNLFVNGGTVSNSSAVTESGDQVFPTRTAAGITTQFPRSASCASSLGLLTVSN